MTFVRRLALLTLLLLGGVGAAYGGTKTSPAPVAGTEIEGMMVIRLEHHWVMELAGQRFGLIQFDTPMTTVLLGRFHLDLPVPAMAIVVPVLTVPLLAGAGVVMHGRRRRNGFYA